MTIAACYVSSEGVVFGADSTASYSGPNSMRHYNHAQKLFEIGEMGSTLGLVTWGRGGFPAVSYRQLVAELSEDLIAKEPLTVEEACKRWIQLFWKHYEQSFAADLAACQALAVKSPRTVAEDKALESYIRAMTVGFCIGGRVRKDRNPMAYQIVFDPSKPGPPIPVPINRFQPIFWGVPNMMERLLYGVDGTICQGILASGHWTGKPADLNKIIAQSVLSPNAELPLRDAIDWIFSSIFVTIKALKFSSTPPFCGGPIEVAVVTADRPFRWVRHKGLDQALSDHATRGKF
ncbi:hypothetical protein [Lacipirellula sp.]|uniref:hypothetical protein n=1 Tax=Lacipirellula sp. TaxID=2691419 RepID=UPI003D0B24DD